MQRTIRLNSNDGYRLNDRAEVEAFVYDATILSDQEPDYDDPMYTKKLMDLDLARYVWKPSKYRVGAEAVLVSRTDVSPNSIRAGRNTPVYGLHFDLAGVPGNSDPKIKRTIGWRGTTDDVSVDAHGVVRITKIRALKNGDIAITVVG